MAAGFVGVTSAAVITWTGATNRNWDDVGTDVNWVDSSSNPTTYSDGEGVIFNDNAGGTSTSYVVTVGPTTTTPTGVTPASINFNDVGGTSGIYEFTSGTGATSGITGATSLILNTGYNGTVYLNSANTYTGGTYINGGTLHGGTGSFLSTNTFNLGGGTFQTASGSGGTYVAGQSFVATAGTSSNIQATATGNNVVINGAISSRHRRHGSRHRSNFARWRDPQHLHDVRLHGDLGTRFVRQRYRAT